MFVIINRLSVLILLGSSISVVSAKHVINKHAYLGGIAGLSSAISNSIFLLLNENKLDKLWINLNALVNIVWACVITTMAIASRTSENAVIVAFLVIALLSLVAWFKSVFTSVKLLTTKDIGYFERQQGAKCAKHAINNLFGKEKISDCTDWLEYHNVINLLEGITDPQVYLWDDVMLKYTYVIFNEICTNEEILQSFVGCIIYEHRYPSRKAGHYTALRIIGKDAVYIDSFNFTGTNPTYDLSSPNGVGKLIKFIEGIHKKYPGLMIVLYVFTKNWRERLNAVATEAQHKRVNNTE